MTESLRRVAASRRDLAARLRRDLHRMPEPGLCEYETTAYLLEFLASRGLSVSRPLPTGAVAEVGEGPHALLLRADIDGLPVYEDTGLDYASRREGWMHACGHDVHAAILLAVADALASGEVAFRGKVTLLFQPAEEGPGGCRPLLEGGFLARHPVRRAVALHVWPDLPVGTVGLSAGPMMAGMDLVRIRFVGTGGHGAYPHRCADPLLMSAEALIALRDLVPGRPGDDLVLSFGRAAGGVAPNVIPETSFLEGTFRWLDAGRRLAMREEIALAANRAAERRGGRCEVEFSEGYPPTFNDGAATETLAAALEETLGSGMVRVCAPTMGSEDMSLLLERVPGCYLRLGAGTPGVGLHSPRFVPEEGCLETGIAAMLAAVSAFCG